MNRTLVERLEKLEARTIGMLVLVWCHHPGDFPAEKAKRIAAGTISERDDVRCVCWKQVSPDALPRITQ